MKTPQAQHLLLAGFSGSGKTTVLAELARLLPQVTCLDLDQMIVQGHTSVAAIVEKEGWPGFRAREADALKAVLARSESVILALGGGALELGWPIIESQGARVVFLECPFEICWQRIAAGTERPLVQQGEAALRRLFEERKPLYQRCQLRVDATRSPRDVALAIMNAAGLA